MRVFTLGNDDKLNCNDVIVNWCCTYLDDDDQLKRALLQQVNLVFTFFQLLLFIYFVICEGLFTGVCSELVECSQSLHKENIGSLSL